MNKRIAILAGVAILLSSCIKPLTDEGIFDQMTARGLVVERTSQQPVDGIHVRLVHAGQTIATTITSATGTFELPLECDMLNSGMSVEVFADSLYDGTSMELARRGYGRQYYEVGTLYVDGPELPTVTTGDVTAIEAVTAHCGGEVTASGKSAVSQRGLCWSTLQYPTLNNAHVPGGGGEGEFELTITGLEVGTIYYVRAYATNGVGTAYGEQRRFCTQAGLPTVQTASEALLSGVGTATCGGTVTRDGGFSVTARGICWSVTPEPTVSNLHTIDGNGVGEFISTLTNLQPATTYYLRAYATNVNGTVYGQQLTLSTQSGLPKISTIAATNITSTTAVSGGEVEDDGGYTVIQRGVCYSTTPQPTTAGPHTTDGAGTGQFVSHLLNLTPNTQYYLRAYATNATGTVYGEERVFITTN